jgi:hypothetical protein
MLRPHSLGDSVKSRSIFFPRKSSAGSRVVEQVGRDPKILVGIFLDRRKSHQCAFEIRKKQVQRDDSQIAGRTKALGKAAKRPKGFSQF